MKESLDHVKRLSFSHRMSKRREATELFADMPPTVAVPELYRMLEDRRGTSADAAAEVMRTRLGSDGRAALTRALGDDHEWRRLAAACSLARERDPGALAALDIALRVEDFAQWAPAIAALCRYGMAAQERLERELLREDNPRFLREMTARALARIAGGAAIPALTAAADSSDQVVARAARSSLEGLDDDEPPLLIGWELAELSETKQTLLRYVLGRQAPDLIERVEKHGLVGLMAVDRFALQGAVADELARSGLTSDDEPNALGLELEELLDAVLRVYTSRDADA